jgi:hypothetical protein
MGDMASNPHQAWIIRTFPGPVYVRIKPPPLPYRAPSIRVVLVVVPRPLPPPPLKPIFPQLSHPFPLPILYFT